MLFIQPEKAVLSHDFKVISLNMANISRASHIPIFSLAQFYVCPVWDGAYQETVIKSTPTISQSGSEFSA